MKSVGSDGIRWATQSMDQIDTESYSEVLSAESGQVSCLPARLHSSEVLDE